MLQCNEFQFVDMAMYIMQVHASKRHYKTLLRRPEMVDVTERVKIMWPLKTDLPTIGVGQIPLEIVSKMNGTPLWKVEWFWDGSIISSKTPQWKERFKFSYCGERGVYQMVSDTMGFSKHDMAMKMWLESLHRPGQYIYYEGKAFMQGSGELKVQKATMISTIYDYNHVMTVTFVTYN